MYASTNHKATPQLLNLTQNARQPTKPSKKHILQFPKASCVNPSAEGDRKRAPSIHISPPQHKQLKRTNQRQKMTNRTQKLNNRRPSLLTTTRKGSQARRNLLIDDSLLNPNTRLQSKRLGANQKGGKRHGLGANPTVETRTNIFRDPKIPSSTLLLLRWMTTLCKIIKITLFCTMNVAAMTFCYRKVARENRQMQTMASLPCATSLRLHVVFGEEKNCKK